MKKIAILANNDGGLYNFRKELIEKILKETFDVTLMLPKGKRINELISMGCHFIEIDVDRRGTNPITDYKLMKEYQKILKEIQPNIVLTYTIKPTIYGGIACQKFNMPYIANITGLGTAVENGGLKQKLIIKLYKKALKKINCVFFQNKANQQFFKDHKIGIKHQLCLPGSGVNLIQHCFEPYPEDDKTIRFLFIGRMMKNKGIDELLEAAQMIKKRYQNVTFDLIGFCEDDYEKQLKALESQKIIRFLGQQEDIHAFIKTHHATILPSYHEGMANVLLESAAAGRPVLASNIPGCQETFDAEISGFGFCPKNTEDLVQKIIQFIALPYEQKKQMGICGRQKMEREFDRQIVVDAYMKEIESILERTKR
ncbi:MAG: glycosyltransferase family 4 protein [Eubacterium sp.]